MKNLTLSLSLLINRIKQQKQNKEKIIILSFSVLISVLFISTITYGATTIGNNINTGGALDVSGATTVYGATSIGGAITATSTLNVTGLTTLGNASTTQLSIAGNLWLNGFATTTSLGNINGQGILTMLGTGTSTFSGGIQSTALNITSATASSTFANGIILSKGCFLMPDGTCAGAGGGSGTINSGTTGQLSYYAGSGTTLTATSSLFIHSNQNIGIGTTTPNWLLQAAGTRPFFTLSDTGAAANNKHWFLSSQGGNFYVGTSSDAYATSTYLTITNGGNVGIGTAGPMYKLDVLGGATFNLRLANTNENANNKLGGIVGRHYLSAEEDVVGFWFRNVNGENIIRFGGGDSNFNTATDIIFYTAATYTTLGGTETMRIKNGNVGIGEAAPGSKLSVSGGVTIGVSYDTVVAPSNGMLIEGAVGIGTSTPTTMFQVATSTANATTTIEVGKENQNKGSCLKMYNVAGTLQYVSIQGGSFVISATSCE